MNYPKYLFPGSFDPMHFGHYQTLLNAQRKYGSVSLLICHNISKGKGFFSLEERAEIASLFIPQEYVCVANSNAQLVAYFENAIKIVRGYRNEGEIANMALSAKLHNVERFSDKLELFKVPKELVTVSSTKLRNLVLVGDYQTAESWTNPKVVESIKQKLLIE